MECDAPIIGASAGLEVSELAFPVNDGTGVDEEGSGKAEEAMKRRSKILRGREEEGRGHEPSVATEGTKRGWTKTTRKTDVATKGAKQAKQGSTKLRRSQAGVAVECAKPESKARAGGANARPPHQAEEARSATEGARRRGRAGVATEGAKAARPKQGWRHPGRGPPKS